MFHRLMRSSPSIWVLPLLFASSVVAFVAVIATFDPDPFAEGATIERGTTALLFLTAATLFVAHRGGPWRNRWHLVAIPVLLGLREMDLDKAFMSEGILQLRLYSGDAPLVEKLTGGAVVVFLVWMILRLIRHDLSGWLQGLRDGNPLSLLLLGAGLAVIVAKTLDGLGRRLEPFGVILQQGAPHVLAAVEESLELGFALALLIAVLLWWQHSARE